MLRAFLCGHLQNSTAILPMRATSQRKCGVHPTYRLVRQRVPCGSGAFCARRPFRSPRRSTNARDGRGTPLKPWGMNLPSEIEQDLGAENSEVLWLCGAERPPANMGKDLMTGGHPCRVLKRSRMKFVVLTPI